MPEASIDENRRPITPHDDVGLAWHALHVEPIAVAVPPQPLPHLQLRFGAFAVDARHHIVALLWGEAVGHGLFDGFKELVEIRKEGSVLDYALVRRNCPMEFSVMARNIGINSEIVFPLA